MSSVQEDNNRKRTKIKEKYVGNGCKSFNYHDVGRKLRGRIPITFGRVWVSVRSTDVSCKREGPS